jgi:hypothetical protein
MNSEELLNRIFIDSYIKKDISLNNFKRFEVSISNQFNIPGIDMDSMINKLLYSEVESTIHKEVFNRITNTNNFDYIDYIGKNIYDGELYKQIVDIILTSNYSLIITNGQIGSIIQDSTNFHFQKQFSNIALNTSSSTYIIGNIGHVKIFVNPYMKFTDNRLIMFNGSWLNLENLIKTDNSASFRRFPFNNQIKFNFGVDIKTSDSKVLFIIDSEKSEGYLQYKSLLREDKINKILK